MQNSLSQTATATITTSPGAMPTPEEELRPLTSLGRLLNPDPKRLLNLISIALLAVWCAWWGMSLVRQDLIGVNRGWFPACFGVDFIWHVDRPTRVWLAGGDPYADKTRMCSYPPLVFRMFSWVGMVTPNQALTIWICVLGLLAAGGAWAAWRCRRQLGLSDVPLSAMLVAMLYSSPMVFAMERGQYDLVTVPIVMAALAIMRRESRWRQVLAGAVLAIAPWAKVYPGLLGIGLAGLRKWDALASFAIVGLAIGAAIPSDTTRFLINNDLHMAEAKANSRMEQNTRVCPWNHSLSDNWPRIWNETPLRFLSKINGYVATALILGPILGWVSVQVYRCRQRDRLAFGYLMWVVAVATFVPPVANDYTLMFLPLAVMSVCHRRDPLIGFVAIAALVIWWQPVMVNISGRVLILMKLAALLSVGVSLAERACALNGASAAELRKPGEFSEKPMGLAA